ncbi:MAG: long-chain-fatty-acid--CoA ligase [Acidimicrobiales bacterium]
MELPLTPLDLLARARRLFSERVGVIDGELQWTYGQFAERCDRLAHLLQREVGVRPGDVVAWLCGNTHDLLEAYYGVLLAGGVLLPLNIRLAPAELRAILDDSGAVALFRHPAEDDPVHSVRTIVLDQTYDALLAAQPDQPPAPIVVDEHAAAELFYTSGSTGSPKGALLSHRGLYLHAIHSALTMGLSGEDVVLHTIPLFHVNGWGTPHYVTGLGGVHVLLPRFEAVDVLRLIALHRVTRLFLVPTMARMLLDHPAIAGHDLSSVGQISVGGAPAGPDLLSELETAFGCPCICGYGMTESGPTLTRSLPKPGSPSTLAQRATTGLPILGVDVRVLGDHDREVRWDGTSVGEVCARSNHVMIGYLGAPDDTAAVLRGGWLRTGDLAVVDPDGYITIVDRAKDLIISGGENVSSVEVEQALESHPAVREAAVIAVSDQRWGEVPWAYVSLRDGADTTERELITWVEDRLAGFKVPKRVAIIHDLPKGGTGKIRKATLRDMAGKAAPTPPT